MQKLQVVTVSTDKSVKDNGMAEIYQSQGSRQALLRRDGDAEFTRITNFVKCRDFLVDTYSYAKENKDFGIYGFSFQGSKMQPDWSAVYVLMRFQDDKSRDQFLTHIDQIIRPIEKKNDYRETALYEVKGCSDIVASADPKWLQNCLSFSLYSLLLRVCCYEFDASKDWITAFSNMKSSDSAYIASVPRKSLHRVFEDLSSIATEQFCGFDPKKDYVGSIHHNSGFISVFGHHTEISPSTVKQNRHWQEMKKRGFETKVA